MEVQPCISEVQQNAGAFFIRKSDMMIEELKCQLKNKNCCRRKRLVLYKWPRFTPAFQPKILRGKLKPYMPDTSVLMRKASCLQAGPTYLQELIVGDTQMNMLVNRKHKTKRPKQEAMPVDWKLPSGVKLLESGSKSSTTCLLNSSHRTAAGGRTTCRTLTPIIKQPKEGEIMELKKKRERHVCISEEAPACSGAKQNTRSFGVKHNPVQQLTQSASGEVPRYAEMQQMHTSKLSMQKKSSRKNHVLPHDEKPKTRYHHRIPGSKKYSFVNFGEDVERPKGKKMTKETRKDECVQTTPELAVKLDKKPKCKVCNGLLTKSSRRGSDDIKSVESNGTDKETQHNTMAWSTVKTVHTKELERRVARRKRPLQMPKVDEMTSKDAYSETDNHVNTRCPIEHFTTPAAGRTGKPTVTEESWSSYLVSAGAELLDYSNSNPNRNYTGLKDADRKKICQKDNQDDGIYIPVGKKTGSRVRIYKPKPEKGPATCRYLKFRSMEQNCCVNKNSVPFNIRLQQRSLTNVDMQPVQHVQPNREPVWAPTVIQQDEQNSTVYLEMGGLNSRSSKYNELQWKWHEGKERQQLQPFANSLNQKKQEVTNNKEEFTTVHEVTKVNKSRIPRHQTLTKISQIQQTSITCKERIDRLGMEGIPNVDVLLAEAIGETRQRWKPTRETPPVKTDVTISHEDAIMMISHDDAMLKFKEEEVPVETMKPSLPIDNEVTVKTVNRVGMVKGFVYSLCNYFRIGRKNVDKSDESVMTSSKEIGKPTEIVTTSDELITPTDLLTMSDCETQTDTEGDGGEMKLRKKKKTPKWMAPEEQETTNLLAFGQLSGVPKKAIKHRNTVLFG